MDLALQSVGLSVKERQCSDRINLCRYATACLAYAQRVYEWIVSALVIVRVFRGVARRRFTFDRHAVLVDGELLMRVASNYPSRGGVDSFSLGARRGSLDRGFSSTSVEGMYRSR